MKSTAEICPKSSLDLNQKRLARHDSALRKRQAKRVLFPKRLAVDECELQLLIAEETRTVFDRDTADFHLKVKQGPPDPYHVQHNRSGRRTFDLVILENDLTLTQKARDYRAHQAQVDEEARKGLVTV